MTEPIKTITEFITEYKNKYPKDHFFDKDTLKFFGERLSDMRLLKTREKIITADGETHICYIISTKQRNAPGGVKKVYHYFDMDTLTRIFKE